MSVEEIINVVICYNNADEVIKYYNELNSLDHGSEIGYVVVINSASENEIEQLSDFKSCNKRVYVFNSKKNLGYINGLLYGYREYNKKTNSIPRYVIMSNTDIAFQDKDILDKLLNKKYEDDVACIGPSILVSELNSYCNPVSEDRYTLKQINKYIRIFSTPVLREAYVTAGFIKPRFIKNKKDFTSRNVYSVHGCFFILTSKYIEYLKNIEYGVLLYSEEIFVSENAYLIDMRTFYDSDIEVLHQEHSTTKKLKPTRRAHYFAESMRWIKDTYYSDISSN